MRLYHLSPNPNLSVMIPRVPQNQATKHRHEDDVVKRVCFASSIHNALKAVPFDRVAGKILYIYTPTSIDNKFVYRPTPSQVPDVSATHETWYLAPVTVKKIGVLVIGDELKRKLMHHPKFPELVAEISSSNYKRFAQKPTKEQIAEYLKTQPSYQEYIRDYRKGILKGVLGTLAGVGVFAFIGHELKRLL